MMFVDPYRFGSGIAEIEYVETDTLLAIGTVFTITPAFGAPSASRRAFVVLHWITSDGQPTGVASVTIDGEPATEHAQASWATIGGSNPGTGIFSALIPEGENLEVIVTMVGTSQAVCVSSYRVTGLVNPVAHDTATAVSSAYVRSTTIDVQARGVLVVGDTRVSPLANDILAGADEDNNDFIGGGVKFTDGSLAVTADQAGRTISITRGDGQTHLATSGVIVAASFR